ncbi:MAG: hypothetical protein KAH84_03620 [Thiomargarita sp.]|nr:hypothetical protein [Thiomargarita sp.]
MENNTTKEQKIKKFGITLDGEKYKFLEYRYDRLEDAISYAEKYFEKENTIKYQKQLKESKSIVKKRNLSSYLDTFENNIKIIIIVLLSIITLLMLKQTFVSPSYAICVTSVSGVPNPPLYCQGDFTGESTVSEMYENGWKLITNVGTSVPTWLFEK